MQTLKKKFTLGTDQWKHVKEVYSPAVVQIEMEYPRSFGVNEVGVSEATGFVVDSKMGIILTNKHVVTAGPIRAKAKFLRNEEVDLVPVYRDPVHDFGFFTFDPSKVTTTPLLEIKLEPEGAKPQTSVLIMGNNAGEKLTYVESTIARVDRKYIEGFDCNTFYISATDITVGGSSGGPMLNLKGNAVAMVAAGNTFTNSSFYLPLYRVARALKLFQKGKPIMRGSIQVAFQYRTYEEVLRLGVSAEVVQANRKSFPDADGMLVVNKNLPKGPGNVAGVHNGDVLHKLNGKLIWDFVALAEVMDESIGKEIVLDLLRGGMPVTVKPIVQDLAEISPSEMIEISDGVISGLEYIVALQFNLPMEGVIISHSGYMFRGSGLRDFTVIVGIGTDKIVDLASFEAAMKKHPNGSVVAVKFFHLFDPVKKYIVQLTVDKRWYPFLYAKRNDVTGRWDYRNCLAQEKVSDELMFAKKGAKQLFEKIEQPKEDDLAKAVVNVSFSSPLYTGDTELKETDEAESVVGIVVNRELGLIVCDRNCVFTTLGDVSVNFNSVLKIPARVLFVHPTSAFSIIQYNPEVVEKDPVAKVFEMKISDERVQVGDKLRFVGATNSQTIVHGKGEVTSLDFQNAQIPFNCEVMRVSGPVNMGAYYNEDDKKIRAFVLNYRQSIPAFYVKPVVDRIQEALVNGRVPPTSIKTLAVHLRTKHLSLARSILNLSDEWALTLRNASDGYRNVLLTVNRRMVGTDSYIQFEDNDVILAVNGEGVCLLSRFLDLIEGKDAVDVTVLREAEIIELTNVRTTEFSTIGLTRVVTFAGMVLHPPHFALYYKTEPEKLIDGGVYVASMIGGSPATVDEVNEEDTPSKAGKIIFKVNNKDIGSIDEFIDLVSQVKHNEYVRISTMNVKTGEISVHNIRLDLEYWPTRDYRRDDVHGWNYTTIVHDKQ